MFIMKNLKASDPFISDLIQKEIDRQNSTLQMIPSENHVSRAVLEAVGSPLMNKYSEGQAFKRYYQGNANIDEIESVVKNRALSLFKLDTENWAVNVQAVTGSIANLAVYSAVLEPGDRILSMHLYDGGHLSHGWNIDGKPVSFTSKIYEPHFYHVDPVTEVFDYAEIEKVAKKVKPKLLISGGTAYPREIDHEAMAKIAKTVGALYMADIAHEAGLVAAGVNASPFPHADIVTMTTRKTLRGPIGAMIFCRSEFEEAINRAVFPGLQGGPQNHSIAGIGVALNEASGSDFRKYSSQIIKNARILAKNLSDAGFHVVSGGTDKHLVLINLSNKGITGGQAATALENAGIIVNKNTVPDDPAKPWNPSGIRLGTPAITTRGLQEKEIEIISEWIIEVLNNTNNIDMQQEVSNKVKKLCESFIVYE